MKSVIVQYYGYHTRKYDKQIIPHVRRIVRTVRRLTKKESTWGLPFKFYEAESIRWAESQTWTRYEGIAKIDGTEVCVQAWAWGDNPPQYWGANTVYHRIPTDPDRIAMWGWQEVHDAPEMGKFCTPDQAVAQRIIDKYL